MELSFFHKNLLGIEGLRVEEIRSVLDATTAFKEISRREIKKVPTLRGRTIVNLFFEPSTRTRTSFELAAKRLSADTVNISASTSSVVKGETLVDTARNLQAMHPDLIILRHGAAGAPHFLSRHIDTPIINAGDGAHEHPTQALLDLYTMEENVGSVEGKTVGIVGDIKHSRVARSNILSLTKMGARVVVCGPPTLIPRGIEALDVTVRYDLDEILPELDIIMMLRIQLERQERGLFPSLVEYSRLYGLNRRRLERCKPEVLVMHPGPINRGIELDPDVADGSRSVILDQVENGLALRMALLYILCGGKHDDS
ncbi:MAG: aspartate carbamoyltransferase [Deltaproteobacteria bacterium]|nr:MAG: aspartate carbamoyltransferase [Deltaproteobacteria bacterium]